MRKNYRLIDKNKFADNEMNDFNVTMEENAEDGPHILHLSVLAKSLYVNNGVELTAISEMFKKHLTLAKIVEFKEEQKWDEERAKLLKIKNTLFGSARQLVKMTLAVAKVDPTANNITAYKRAIESLIVLKKTMPVKKTVKDELLITPENIAQFADAAGLDYTPDPVPSAESSPDNATLTEEPGKDTNTLPEE